MPSEYSREFTVSISDCDPRGHWRPSAMLIAMQELAEVHAASFGLSRMKLVESGIVWILYRQRIEMQTYPSFGETVRLVTWPDAIEGPIFPRYFLLEKEDGTVIGRAATSWILMDIRSRRPMRPSALPGKVPPNTEREPALALPGMLRVESDTLLTERTVRYSDLDVNGHMNNTRYIDWICDVLPLDTLLARGLSDCQINYISEARPGETLALYGDTEGSTTRIAGKRADGKPVFEASVTLG